MNSINKHAYRFRLNGLESKFSLLEPDNTFYETVKGINLIENHVIDLPSSSLPCPKSLKLSPQLKKAWKTQHAPLIEAAYKGKSFNQPVRSIFPGPYIPALDGKMVAIGDYAYQVFEHILQNIKQRIPEIKKITKNSLKYIYTSGYKPIERKITESEEVWGYVNIKCPIVKGITFPLPPTYEYETSDNLKLESALNKINAKCSEFCLKYVGKETQRTKEDVLEIVSYLVSVQNLYKKNIPPIIIKAFDEVLTCFDKLDQQPEHPAKFLFEVEHAVSYLAAIKDFRLLCFGKYSTFWVDILRLPLENLIETEFCDIQRVLREIMTFFALGWSPIVVHLDNKLGFNTDGTHRHYALLSIELLRRLKSAHNKPLRKIDLNSPLSYKTIIEFQNRYKKYGLSFRETLRVVNHLVNSDNPWPYLSNFEDELENLKETEFKYIPVIYLPEWRARSVVKSLCDKGIALIGVPPENIQIVGRSQGKKGIFIRGGYHGTDRQPMVWMDIKQLNKYDN